MHWVFLILLMQVIVIFVFVRDLKRELVFLIQIMTFTEKFYSLCNPI